MPYSPVDGGAQLIHNTTLGLLANGVKLKTLAINPARNFIDPATLPPDYLHSTGFESVRVDTRISLAGMLFNIFSKESYFVSRFHSKDFALKLIEILSRDEYDIVQLEHLYLCLYADVIRKHTRAKIVFRPQNVEYVIWERYLAGVKNPVKKYFLRNAVSRLKKMEQKVREEVDGIIPVTPDDAGIFATFPGCSAIEVVPMGYDHESLKEYDFEKQYRLPLSFYHLASMDWLPNEEAVRWFLENVLPLIKDKGDKVKVKIAGRRMPSWVYRYKSQQVMVEGEVTKPLVFQEDAAVMIVPLFSGSGIRAKIIEGMALGKTIISTTIGAQGIACENEKNILIADTPEDFARQIMRCADSRDLCRKIGGNARVLSLEKYDHVVNAMHMIRFYRQIMSHPG